MIRYKLISYKFLGVGHVFWVLGVMAEGMEHGASAFAKASADKVGNRVKE